MITSKFQEITFGDADVVNPDDYGSVGSGRYRPWLLHDSGFVQAVVIAENESDALDAAADAGKLDGFQVTEEEEKDYPDGEGLDYLGNYCKAYDIESVSILEMPMPAFSFCALFNAEQARARVLK